MTAENSKTEVKVGLFVLAALMVLGYMSLRLGSETLAPKKGYELRFLVDSASGLALNTKVEMAGIEIGRIKNISVSGRKALVTLNIYKDYRIAADSVAWIRTKGIIGDKFVEIRQGEPGKGVLPPNGRITSVVRPVDLDELFVSTGPFMEDMESIARGLNAMVGSEENLENLQKILGNLRDASESIRIIASNLEKGKGFMGQMFTDENLFEQTKESLLSLKVLADKINNGEGTLGKLVTDDSLYEEIKKAAASLHEFAERIERGEGTLGKLARDDTLYEDAKAALHSVNKAAEGVQEQVPVTIFGTLVGTAVH